MLKKSNSKIALADEKSLGRRSALGLIAVALPVAGFTGLSACDGGTKPCKVGVFDMVMTEV